jgi:spore coat protein U-like protein
MTSIRKISLAAALVAGIGFSADSFAGTSTAPMNISAVIAHNCTLTAVPPAAYPYDGYFTNATANFAATFNITYTCTTGAAPVITLDQGANPLVGSTAVAPARQMANGTARLAYNIFSSTANQTTASVGVAWGTNLAMGPTLVAGNGSAQTVPAYIAIIAGQVGLPVGTYTDTVTMTATF